LIILIKNKPQVMKAIQLTLMCLLFWTAGAMAQQKPVGKAVISVPGAQCEKCKERIELYLTRQYGVGTVNVNWRKKNVTVNWFTDRTDIEQIKTHIANCGYDADDVTADEVALKKLPPTCKHPLPPAPKTPATPNKE
jgi:periplasmic mercuric ion binding protein